jgi:hypothetical protein
MHRNTGPAWTGIAARHGPEYARIGRTARGHRKSRRLHASGIGQGDDIIVTLNRQSVAEPFFFASERYSLNPSMKSVLSFSAM